MRKFTPMRPVQQIRKVCTVCKLPFSVETTKTRSNQKRCYYCLIEMANNK